MAEYQGMRWFKCDFQVQTPEDARHWDDADLRLSEPRNEKDIQEKARIYLRRCHELELQVIGVTDHNFSHKTNPRDWFLTHLVEQNATVAGETGREPLTIFPGFEVDIGYHLLCLFEPVKNGAGLSRINDVLTTLGLAPAARFDRQQPVQLRHDGAAVRLRVLLAKVQQEAGGIVIAAHAFSDRGICNDAANIGDYRLPELHCVEATEVPLRGKQQQILLGHDPKWCRDTRQPAYIMSSDAKSLKVDEAGKPVKNALGYRWSWLKMSQPSIEALRQAFLDNESRIRFGLERPSDLEGHPFIQSIEIRGAGFLQDQKLVFSPNLNCAIGGRGSGKSTVLELLRLALQPSIDPSLPKTVVEKIQAVQGMLQSDNGEVRVAFSLLPGVEDVVVFGRGVHRFEGREVFDLKTVLDNLQVQFFSQGELTRITDNNGQAPILRLVDANCAPALKELDGQEVSLRTELQQRLAAQHQATALKQNIKRVAQELDELSRAWQARKDIQAEALVHQRAVEAKRYVTQTLESAKTDSERLQNLVDELVERHAPLGSLADEWLSPQWFKAFDQGVLDAREAVKLAVETALKNYRDKVSALVAEGGGWPELEVQLDAAKVRFEVACREKGLQPEDVSRLQELDRQRQVKQIELDGKKKQLVAAEAQAADYPTKLAVLHDVWRKQFALRQAACASVSERAKAIRLTVNYMRDKVSFDAVWGRLAPKDSRTRLGKNWQSLGDAVFKAFSAELAEKYASPWALIKAWQSESFSEFELDPQLELELFKHLDSEDVRPNWEHVSLTRVADAADIVLLREDGIEAGRMSGGADGRRLSEGQRNTAVLNLVLAQGEGPVVIDQPEDELDSNFIFSDLVPLLRGLKGKRQLIMATHNANLPVNADAELIYALEARDGRGRPLAEGGLDRETVSKAVLDIMEGSETAFRRRSEKYHF